MANTPSEMEHNMTADTATSITLRCVIILLTTWFLAAANDSALGYCAAAVATMAVIGSYIHELRSSYNSPWAWYKRYNELLIEYRHSLVDTRKLTDQLSMLNEKILVLGRDKQMLTAACLGQQVKIICEQLEIPEYLIKVDEKDFDLEIGDDEKMVYVDLDLIGKLGLEGAIAQAKEKWQEEKLRGQGD